MRTYAEIAERARSIGGCYVKTCWIAHVLSDYRLTSRLGHNRIDPTKRQHPCPEAKRWVILAAMSELGLI